MSRPWRRLWLDISHILYRAKHPTPSGIDRVELTYARHFRDSAGFDVEFVAGRSYGLARLPRPAVGVWLERLAHRWAELGGGEAKSLSLEAVLAAAEANGRKEKWLPAPWFRTLGGLPISAAPRRSPEPPLYLKVANLGLEATERYARFKARTGSRMMFAVHDLVPLRYPEYVLPGEMRRHARRMETVIGLADLLLFNSTETKRDLEAYCREIGRPMPASTVLEYGVEPTFQDRIPPVETEKNLFVCVGTIEPRKNHLLLLHVWRDLVEAMGTNAPKLLLIGHNGWENENILDLLERSRSLRGMVFWLRHLPDRAVRQCLRGARAALIPSFAEGYGLPVVEALAAGVPVICSDLPSFREAGRGVPDFIGPLDGEGWRRAILEYSTPASPRREAQLRRLRSYRPTTWRDHFAALEGRLSDLHNAAAGTP